MSKLTLDAAIKYCLEVADKNETKALSIEGTIIDRVAKDCTKCAADHRQLAEWLIELKELREENKVLISECDRLIKEKGELLKKSERIAEYKRLLKAAVKDINFYVDCFESHCDECCCDHDNHCHWKHEAEALELIGEDINVPANATDINVGGKKDGERNG